MVAPVLGDLDLVPLLAAVLPVLGHLVLLQHRAAVLNVLHLALKLLRLNRCLVCRSVDVLLVPLRLRCVWTAARASSHRGGDVQYEQEQEDVQVQVLAPLSLKKMQGVKIFCSNSHDLILQIDILCQTLGWMEWSGE